MFLLKSLSIARGDYTCWHAHQSLTGTSVIAANATQLRKCLPVSRMRHSNALFDCSRIRETIDEICYWVVYHRIIYSETVELPGRFLNARNIAFERLLAEADAAQVEITHKTARAAALGTAAHGARTKLRFSIGLYDH